MPAGGASNSNVNRPPSPEPIPLQDLRPPGEEGNVGSREYYGTSGTSGGNQSGHLRLYLPSDDGIRSGERWQPPSQDTASPNVQRSRSLLKPIGLTAEIGRRLSTSTNPFAKASYERVFEEPGSKGRTRTESNAPATILGISEGGTSSYVDEDDIGDDPNPVEFREGLFDALGISESSSRGGLEIPGGWGRGGSWLSGGGDVNAVAPWVVGPEDGRPMSSGTDDDTAPLTDPRNTQPIAGSTLRSSQFKDVFGSGGMLGEDLLVAEQGMSRLGSTSRRKSISQLSGSSPVRRLSVAVQSISQRVVNLGNDAVVEQNIRRRPSQRVPGEAPISETEASSDQAKIPLEDEDKPIPQIADQQRLHLPRPHRIPHKEHLWRQQQANPLKGASLRIFGPNNWLRLRLCDVLVHPVTEPLILLLIMIQAILLTIDALPSVFTDPRNKRWGTSNVDYAILALFIIYTLEITARIIVSGFIVNPRKTVGPDPRGGFRRRVTEKARELISPQKIEERPRSTEPIAPSILRSLTNLQTADGIPANTQAQQRYRLARRAFLRHSFNRLDFVAVCSYWISLGLTLSGYESQKHLYVFRMMGCLRILRLLGITSGTSVILRSMKKAAPLLVNVMILIGFFWLIFAIIGVQSFKSSLRRHCVWIDPAGVQANYTQSFQFCGGYLNATTGLPEPYLNSDGSVGAKYPKGYICPINSLCVIDQNPFGGTVSFDDILHSIELVFVIMSGNTFSSLLYYTADSDYLAAALFFVFGIVILAFWLVNLLIAVITSSFQVIREESKASAFTANDEDSLVDSEDKLGKKIGKLKRAYDKTYWLWIIIISAGFFAQMFKSSRMSHHRVKLIDNIEMAVTLALTLEVLLRFISDWRHFHQSRRNWVDSGLVVITLIMLIPALKHMERVYAWLTIFQIVRVYRLVWAVPVTRHLLAQVLGNVSGLFNLIFFVILITYLCAIFAVQLLRGDIPQQEDGEDIRITFFTIYNSFLGMYQIFSSENWTDILYNATMFQNPFKVGWITAIFFIGWFILANFIILNMFIAVIQENFDVSEDEKRMYQVKAFLQRRDIGVNNNFSLGSVFRRKNKDPTDFGGGGIEMLTKEAVVDSFLEDERTNRPLPRAPALHVIPQEGEVSEVSSTKFSLSRSWDRITRIWKPKEVNPFYARPILSHTHHDLAPTAMAQEVVSAQEKLKRMQREYLRKHPNYNVSLFLFKPSNPVRRLCQRLVWPGRGNYRYDGLPPYRSAWLIFSSTVYAAIVAMVVLACVTTPLYQKRYFETQGYTLRNWFTYADAGFACLFTLEFAIKAIADGLIWTPNAYLRGSWGIIDCVVLTTLWVSVLASLREQGEIARAVGAFKALRALRLLSVSDRARNTLHAIIVVGGRKIISAAFVSLSLLIPFAVYGVNLFAGLMDSCNDGSNDLINLTDCVHEYYSSPFAWNVLAPRAVQNPYTNFDTFGSALFILFQIASQEGWTDISWMAQSIVGKGKQPQPFASQGNAIFFLAFNLLGAVFVLTLFVSVFMRNYTEQTGVAFLTAEQRSWLELRKLLRQVSPSKRPPDSPDASWKSWCYYQSTNKRGWWPKFMTWVLALHSVLLLIEYYPSPPSLDRIRDFLFLFFTLIFLANITVRIVGLTWSRFIRSRWDVYGLVSVVGTFITTVMLLFGFDSRAFIQLQKLFLVSLVFMLIPRNDQLDHLFKTASASLPSIGSLMATWFVLFLVYAIALTQTFGLTRVGPNGSGNVNFRTVPKAMVLLFRMSCGEGWNAIMSDFEISQPFCVRGNTFLESDCGSRGYARALFVSWNILSMYFFVNLFVSLIFESFSYVYQRSGNLSSVSRDEIRKFKQVWSKFDPDGTGYISVEQFPKLLGKLSGLFSMRIYEEPYSINSILDDCRTNYDTPGSFSGVDLETLSRRLSSIPIHKIRRQRFLFNLFYEEIMVTADKDLGVSFTSLLITLAHYKIINDSKSLRLEEFLRRQWRMQKVEDQVKRNIVKGFFLTLYWQKRFRQMRGIVSIARPRPPASANPFGTFEEDPVSPAVPQIFVNKDEGSETSSPKVKPLDLGDSSNFSIPRKPQIGISIDSTMSAASQVRGSSIAYSTSIPNSPHLSPSGSPRGSPRGSPISGSPPMSPSGLRERASSPASAQSVLGEALEASEWGRQIRSFVARSPSSSGLRNRSTSNAGTTSRGRSPSRSPSPSNGGYTN